MKADPSHREPHAVPPPEVEAGDRLAASDRQAPGVILYEAPGFGGVGRHLGDTGWAAYSLAALGLGRVGSVRVVPGQGGREDAAARVFRAQLFDRAPVYLGTGADARRHRLDVTADLPDSGGWADRVRYVTVSSCRTADAAWGLDRVLAAGEPVRYTLVEPLSGGLGPSADRTRATPLPPQPMSPSVQRAGRARCEGSQEQ